MFNIPKDLLPILNPENKQLTGAQWKNAYDKYLLNETKRKEIQDKPSGERSGVCACGNKGFRLTVILGSGGKMERRCSNENCTVMVIID